MLGRSLVEQINVCKGIIHELECEFERGLELGAQWHLTGSVSDWSRLGCRDAEGWRRRQTGTSHPKALLPLGFAHVRAKARGCQTLQVLEGSWKSRCNGMSEQLNCCKKTLQASLGRRVGRKSAFVGHWFARAVPNPSARCPWAPSPRVCPGRHLRPPNPASGSESGQHPTCSFHFTSHLQVFVWVGKDSQEEEKTEALNSGEDPSLPVGLLGVVGWEQLPHESGSLWRWGGDVLIHGQSSSSALPGVAKGQLGSFRKPWVMPGKGRNR